MERDEILLSFVKEKLSLNINDFNGVFLPDLYSELVSENDNPCRHKSGTTASWDYVTCNDCGFILTGNHKDRWGIASGMWFKSISDADFFKKNGKLPEGAGYRAKARF